MTQIVELVADHGGLLLAGTTLLLGLTVLALRLSGSPVHRQRLGEIALAATLLWALLACVPLPRFEISKLAGRLPIDFIRGDATPWAARRRPAAGDPLISALGNQAPAAGVQPAAGPSNDSWPEATLEGNAPASEDIRSTGRSVPPRLWQLLGRPALVLLYFIGALGSVLWMATGRLLLARAERLAAGPQPWLAQAHQFLPLGPHGRRTRLLVSDRCRRPLVYGLWRPRIMLPEALCRPEKMSQLRHVLLHESVHVWRRDAWGNLLFNIACPLLYFHPLYWWLRFEVEFSRDLIADDWAAGLSTKESYVDDLVQLVRKGQRLPLGSIAVLGIFRFHTAFYRRMTMLIDREKPLPLRTSRTWRFLGLVVCGGVLAVMVGLMGTPQAGAGADATAPANDKAASDEAGEGGPSSNRQLHSDSSTSHQAKQPTAGSRREAPARRARPSRSSGYGSEAESHRRGATGYEDEYGGYEEYDEGAYGGEYEDYYEDEEDLSGRSRARRRTRRPPTFELSLPIRGLLTAEQLEPAAQTEGVLVELAVREGDQVERGQVIARIDDERVRLKLQEAMGNLKNLKALEIAVEEAKVEREHAQHELRRVQELRAAAAMSESEISRTQFEFARAELREDRAKAELESARQLREIQVATAENELKRCQVRAPLGGIVTKTYRKVGEWVNPGDPICRIVNMSRLRVEAFVDLSRGDLHQLAGRDVTVEVKRTDGGTDYAPGKIIFVAPSVEPGPQVRLVADLENPTRDGRWVLRPGLEAEMRVKRDQAARAERPND